MNLVFLSLLGTIPWLFITWFVPLWPLTQTPVSPCLSGCLSIQKIPMVHSNLFIPTWHHSNQPCRNLYSPAGFYKQAKALLPLTSEHSRFCTFYQIHNMSADGPLDKQRYHFSITSAGHLTLGKTQCPPWQTVLFCFLNCWPSLNISLLFRKNAGMLLNVTQFF